MGYLEKSKDDDVLFGTRISRLALKIHFRLTLQSGRVTILHHTGDIQPCMLPAAAPEWRWRLRHSGKRAGPRWRWRHNGLSLSDNGRPHLHQETIGVFLWWSHFVFVRTRLFTWFNMHQYFWVHHWPFGGISKHLLGSLPMSGRAVADSIWSVMISVTFGGWGSGSSVGFSVKSTMVGCWVSTSPTASLSVVVLLKNTSGLCVTVVTLSTPLPSSMMPEPSSSGDSGGDWGKRLVTLKIPKRSIQ